MDKATQIRCIHEDSAADIELEPRDEIEHIRNGGEFPPWMTREQTIADLEAQIAALYVTESTDTMY